MIATDMTSCVMLWDCGVVGGKYDCRTLCFIAVKLFKYNKILTASLS